VTRLREGRLEIRGSIPDAGRALFLYYSVLSCSGSYLAFYPAVTKDISLENSLSTEIKMHGAIPAFLHTPSYRGA
jgi:hypothetical protein